MNQSLIVLIVAVHVLFFCQLGFSTENREWNLNDVSYLFPMPSKENNTLGHLLTPQTMGAKGALLPSSIINLLPTLLNAGNGNPTLFKGAIRLVSLRLDPCPSLDESNCHPEIRLVWQPIEQDSYENKWLSRDAAIHSIYSLSKDEMELLTDKLWSLKIANENKSVFTHYSPLGVHPGFLNEKTSTDFNNNLRGLVLKNCGQNNLEKVTFMSLLVPTRWWRFGSFIRNGLGGWTAEEIPRLWGATSEDIFNVGREENGSSKGPGKAMDAIINVLPEEYPAEDDISEIINKGYRQNNEDDYPIFKEKLNAVERFRNPLKTHSSNLDCASCHYADAAKFYAETQFPDLKSFKSVDKYKNPNEKIFNLQNKSIAKEATRVVRAFGYFDDLPAINQRTINDSAESAHWLNTH